MKRTSLIFSAIALFGMVVVSAIALAQEPQAGTVVVQPARTMQGPETAPPPPPDGNVVFVASEIGFSGKTITGAPYSAQAVTETIQTLSDGNRIVNKVTTSLYRDTDGRTRREQTLKTIGGIGNAEPIETIFINDPVARVSYALDTRSHTAVKRMPFTFEQKVMAPPGGEVRQFAYSIVVPETPSPRKTALPAQAPPAPPLEQGEFTYQTDSASSASIVFTRKKTINPNEVKEDLGKQIIEGVEAEGSRTTVTIPAGEIGNERPIEIVNETWYSPDLQVVVMSRHSDPRFGETTYKLTNISRIEPARSLFEVPADYTVKEGTTRPPGVVLPARRAKPGSPE